jgi:hypothetical protein
MSKSTKTAIEPELLEIADAAKYLRVSVSHFNEHLRKLIPMVDMASPGSKVPVIRFAKADLDAFIASRRRAVA